MIVTLLTLLGLGQAESHRSEDQFSIASSHLAGIEKTFLETGLTLTYEINRLGRLAENTPVSVEVAVAPLVEMYQQNERMKELGETNRELLQKTGANAQVVAELERWAGTCQIMQKQIDLTVRQIEDALLRC